MGTGKYLASLLNKGKAEKQFLELRYEYSQYDELNIVTIYLLDYAVQIICI